MTRYRWLTWVAVSLLVVAAGCGTGGTPTDAGPSEERCGDGVCDGPEDSHSCPGDCGALPALDACLDPNPHRAIVSDLLEWYDWLDDGGFEAGRTEVVVTDLAGLAPAAVGRSREAARLGEWGYAIAAGDGQGSGFFVRAYVEKGEDIRFSFWVRSPNGPVDLEPLVFWIENEADWGVPTRARAVTVGPNWTEVQFVAETTKGVRCVLLGFETSPGTTLHVDDVHVALPVWRMAEYAGSSRTVGGIPVPVEPVAPVYFTFVIHIEDPALLATNEAYFQEQSAIFRELARVFCEHGGFLTIQPEQDWAQAAEAGFDPGLLAQLADEYGVVYSTHTHGPSCRDDGGMLRSSADCGANPGWDRALSDDDVIAYAKNLRDLLEAASGTPVTDHNGNWDFAQASRYAEIPMLTISAYKNHTTQRTYDRLINNPWRPGQGNAVEDVERFLTHDPDTTIVYIPGWGQALSRHPERLLTRLRPMISQFIFYADPDRVNTFYGVLHVGHFHADDHGSDYIVYDERSGELTYSAEFLEDLAYVDGMLTELIDPLVAEGYLVWASLPEMGARYLTWEEDCALR